MCSGSNNKTAQSEEENDYPEVGVRLEVEEVPSSDSESHSSENGVANSTIAEPGDSDREEEGEEPSCSSEGVEGGDGEGIKGEDDEDGPEKDETACTECPESEVEDAEDIPDSAYPECSYYRYLEDDLLPNSSIPSDLSNGESVELCTIPIFDEEAYVNGGQPETRIRGCRSPDKSRVVMMWKVYEDLDQMYDYQSNWDDPPALEAPCAYTIVAIPGKGTGMRAARDIGCGETILLERPIVLFPSQVGSYEELEADLKVMVGHLEQKDQEAIEAMCNSQPSSQCGELSGKMLTNVMKCTFPQSTYATSYSGVCLDASKANHSCSANMIYEFNHENVLMEYRATRDIREGEELCISYIDPTRPFSDRQEHLQSVYGFKCLCDACTRVSTSEVNIKLSDERREKVKEQSFTMAERWRKWLEVSLPGTTKLIEEYKELLSDVEEEGLFTYRPVLIRWLAYSYAALGNEVEFRKWCKEAVICFGTLCATGKGFLNADIWRVWLENPNSVPFWGMRQGNKWV